MVSIQNATQFYFTLDGITYPKIFQPIKQGTDSLGIYNIYDTRQQVLGATNFAQVSVEGVVYTTLESAITALSSILYAPRVVTEGIARGRVLVDYVPNGNAGDYWIADEDGTFVNFNNLVAEKEDKLYYTGSGFILIKGNVSSTPVIGMPQADDQAAQYAQVEVNKQGIIKGAAAEMKITARDTPIALSPITDTVLSFNEVEGSSDPLTLNFANSTKVELKKKGAFQCWISGSISGSTIVKFELQEHDSTGVGDKTLATTQVAISGVTVVKNIRLGARINTAKEVRIIAYAYPVGSATIESLTVYYTAHVQGGSGSVEGLGTAAYLDAGLDAGNVPVVQVGGKLDPTLYQIVAAGKVHVSQESTLALFIQNELPIIQPLWGNSGDIVIITQVDPNGYQPTYQLLGDDPEIEANYVKNGFVGMNWTDITGRPLALTQQSENAKLGLQHRTRNLAYEDAVCGDTLILETDGGSFDLGYRANTLWAVEVFDPVLTFINPPTSGVYYVELIALYGFDTDVSGYALTQEDKDSYVSGTILTVPENAQELENPYRVVIKKDLHSTPTLNVIPPQITVQ